MGSGARYRRLGADENVNWAYKGANFPLPRLHAVPRVALAWGRRRARGARIRQVAKAFVQDGFKLPESKGTPTGATGPLYIARLRCGLAHHVRLSAHRRSGNAAPRCRTRRWHGKARRRRRHTGGGIDEKGRRYEHIERNVDFWNRGQGPSATVGQARSAERRARLVRARPARPAAEGLSPLTRRSNQARSSRPTWTHSSPASAISK